MGVVIDQALVWSKGFGLRNASDPDSVVDEHSVFRIGSISKVFALLQFLVARDKGLVHLDTAVRDVEPRFGLRTGAQPATARGVTFRQLATHMGGLPRETPCDGGSLDDCFQDNDEMYARIRNLTQILPPDTRPVYSNLGFATLGHTTCSLLSGKGRASEPADYAPTLQKFVLDPLGVSSTSVNGTVAPARLARPYERGFTATAPAAPCDAPCLRDFGWGDPCGSMYSTVHDLAEVVKLVFRPHTRANAVPGQIIDGATIRETLLPRYIESARQNGYGLVWELYREGDYMIRTKRGDVNGYASELIMVPELKLGIVVLANVMEHAQDAAQAMSGILVGAVDAWYRAQDTPAPPNPDVAFAAGVYAAGDGNGEIPVYASETGARLLMGWGGIVMVLEPMAHDGGGGRLFQMTPRVGTLEGCSTYLDNDHNQVVRFHGDGAHAEAVTLDIAWGVRWERKG